MQSSKENTPNHDRYTAGSYGSSTPYSNRFAIFASLDWLFLWFTITFWLSVFLLTALKIAWQALLKLKITVYIEKQSLLIEAASKPWYIAMMIFFNFTSPILPGSTMQQDKTLDPHEEISIHRGVTNWKETVYCIASEYVYLQIEWCLISDALRLLSKQMNLDIKINNSLP